MKIHYIMHPNKNYWMHCTSTCINRHHVSSSVPSPNTIHFITWTFISIKDVITEQQTQRCNIVSYKNSAPNKSLLPSQSKILSNTARLRSVGNSTITVSAKTLTHTPMHTQSTFIHISKHACILTYMHTHIHTYVHTYNINIYLQTFIHTYIIHISFALESTRIKSRPRNLILWMRFLTWQN
jgi:hypothetical protein